MKAKKAFVLMPFTESLSDVYDFLIRGSLLEAGYEVKRADDIKSQSNILEDIIKGIIESDIVVADLTDSNANVYYELGVAHALQKKVILITQDIDELPFDLKSYRVIGYTTHFSRMNEARQELFNLSKDALNGDIPFGNPVKDYGNTKHIADHINQTMDPQSQGTMDMGLLDYVIRVEDDFLALTDIVASINNKLIGTLTPEITKTTQKLNNSNLTAKQRREIIKSLAQHIDDYASVLKPRNEEYRELNKRIETGIEKILTLNPMHDESSIEGVKSFLKGFEALEDKAQDGKDGFLILLNVMINLPSVEASFNSANKEMQREVQLFIDNIDQTIAMASRAMTIGKSMIASNQNIIDKDLRIKQ